MELFAPLIERHRTSLNHLRVGASSPLVLSISSGLYQELCSAVALWYELTRREEYLRCRGAYGAILQDEESVLMGYDFHIVDRKPKLIEVNTNAGGVLFALLAEGLRIQEGSFQGRALADIEQALHQLSDTFFYEYARYAAKWGIKRPLKQIAIVDDHIDTALWKDEFKLYAELFRLQGLDVTILPVDQLQLTGNRLKAKGKSIDMVYNRWCDFYLEDEVSQPLREAFLKGYCSVSPNPVEYHRSAHKEVFTLFSDPSNDEALGISRGEREKLDSFLPFTRLLSAYDADTLRKKRKKLFFKPLSLYGAKGVYRGDKISMKKLQELPKDEYLVQELLPPDTIESEQKTYKYDLRLLCHHGRLISVLARCFQGQVMGFGGEGCGYAPVAIEKGE